MATQTAAAAATTTAPSSPAPTRQGSVGFGSYQTWFRVAGSLDSANPTLVCVHGGPGACSDYLWPLEDLAASHGLTVLNYDQLGNGRSTHLPERLGDVDFWTPQLFKAELANLVEKLGLNKTGYYLLGHSWGGMLCADFASDRPPGLRKLIVSNSPADIAHWVQVSRRLRDALPADVQATLDKHEAAKTTDSKEYADAADVFYRLHVCRVVPFPQAVADSFGWIEKDPTVYHTMNGPSEFHIIGSLKTYSLLDKLPRISVPTLVLGGAYDEAVPESVAPYADHIPDARFELFEDASHMIMFEHPAKYRRTVADFLLA